MNGPTLRDLTIIEDDQGLRVEGFIIWREFTYRVSLAWAALRHGYTEFD